MPLAEARSQSPEVRPAERAHPCQALKTARESRETAALHDTPSNRPSRDCEPRPGPAGVSVTPHSVPPALTPIPLLRQLVPR